MGTKRDPRTDRELVIECWPEAAIEAQASPWRHGRLQYRVVFGPVSRRRPPTTAGWFMTEPKAWQAACIRLGLRTREA